MEYSLPEATLGVKWEGEWNVLISVFAFYYFAECLIYFSITTAVIITI
jgi:hypothetical protein